MNSFLKDKFFWCSFAYLFRKALRVLTNTGPLYGKGNEQFLLERLECTGTESSVFKCAHLEWKRNRCTAAQNVAGLICAENRGELNLRTRLRFSFKTLPG